MAFQVAAHFMARLVQSEAQHADGNLDVQRDLVAGQQSEPGSPRSFPGRFRVRGAGKRGDGYFGFAFERDDALAAPRALAPECFLALGARGALAFQW